MVGVVEVVGIEIVWVEMGCGKYGCVKFSSSKRVVISLVKFIEISW